MLKLLLLASIAAINPYADGTLLFIKGGNRTVRACTGSPYSHVAIIMTGQDGKAYVYESDRHIGVRMVSLEHYLSLCTKNKMQVLVAQPKIAFSAAQRQRMLRYLQSQSGRPYSIRSYINGRECNGIHCAELVSNALKAAGIHITCNHALMAPCDIFDRTIGVCYGKPKVILIISRAASLHQRLRWPPVVFVPLISQ